MKTTLLLIAFAITGVSHAIAQSKSFQALAHKFSSTDDVHTFTTSGFLARTVLWLAGENEFKKAIKEVRKIRVMSIPLSAFADHHVSVEGFKEVLLKDQYSQLAQIRENSEEVTVYIQSAKTSSLNRYLILIHNPEEVVAVELKGYIDADVLNRKYHQRLTYNP
jgi:hypothetical protein